MVQDLTKGVTVSRIREPKMGQLLLLLLRRSTRHTEHGYSQSRPLRTALTIGHPHQPRAPFRAYAPRHTLPQLLCCATPASRILALITLSPALYHSPQASVLAKLASPGFPGATAASAAAERHAPYAAEPSRRPAAGVTGG